MKTAFFPAFYALLLTFCPIVFSVTSWAGQMDQTVSGMAVISKARSEIYNGQVRSALNRLSRFVFDDPKNPLASEAWFMMGECQERLGNKKRALSFYKRLLDDGNYRTDLLLDKIGDLSSRLGDNQAALEAFRQLAEMGFNKAQNLEKIADQLILLDKKEEAILTLKNRRQMAPPPDKIGDDLLASLLLETNSGIKEIEELLSKDSLRIHEKNLLFRLGIKGNIIEPILKKILGDSSLPRDTVILEGAQFLFDGGNYSQCAGLLQGESGRKSFAQASLLAKALYFSDEKAKAVQIMEEWAEKSDNFNGYRDGAVFLKKLGLGENALTFMEKAVEIYGEMLKKNSALRDERSVLFLEKASIYAILGQWESAIDAAFIAHNMGNSSAMGQLEEIIKEDPNKDKNIWALMKNKSIKPDILTRLTDIAFRLGLYEQAMNGALLLLENNRERSSWALILANRLLEKDWDIRPILGKLIENPKSGDIGPRILLAKLEMERGNNQKALELLKFINSQDALEIKARSMMFLGQIEMALENAQKIDKANNLKAEIYASSGDVKKGALLYQPEGHDEIFVLARMQIGAGFFDSGEISLKAVMADENPNFATFYSAMLLDIYRFAKNDENMQNALKDAMAHTFLTFDEKKTKNFLSSCEYPMILGFFMDICGEKLENYGILSGLGDYLGNAKANPSLLWWKAKAWELSGDNSNATGLLMDLVKEYPLSPHALMARKKRK